jgi:hypothetical protein
MKKNKLKRMETKRSKMAEEYIIKHFDHIYIDVFISQYICDNCYNRKVVCLKDKHKATKFYNISEKVNGLKSKDKFVDGTLLLKMMGKKVIKQIISIHSKDILLESLRTIGGNKYIEPLENSIYLNYEKK